jgi:hypothetical protein
MLDELLKSYRSVSLEQMGKVKLLNRVDTKFVTTSEGLEELLRLASDSYAVQEIEGHKIMPYSTLYFDTEQCTMYAQHQRGKKNREKIRVRRYEGSGLCFLEVKRKNNKGRTDKKRIQIPERMPDTANYEEFLSKYSRYSGDVLIPQLSNNFRRMTLVNAAMTERLTIDTDLRFFNEVTGLEQDMENLAIIEVKRDGLTYSPVLAMLNQLRIHESGFSKYCIGMTLTNHELKSNRFKERIRAIGKLTASPSIIYK